MAKFAFIYQNDFSSSSNSLLASFSHSFHCRFTNSSQLVCQFTQSCRTPSTPLIACPLVAVEDLGQICNGQTKKIFKLHNLDVGIEAHFSQHDNQNFPFADAAPPKHECTIDPPRSKYLRSDQRTKWVQYLRHGSGLILVALDIW